MAKSQAAIVGNSHMAQEAAKELQKAQEFELVWVNGEDRDRVRQGEEGSRSSSAPCSECTASLGQFHVIGCNGELCPGCGKSLMKCRDRIEFE